MAEVLMAVALFCQVHADAYMGLVVKTQNQCQQKLTKCIIESKQLAESKALLHCVADGAMN
jgi:hypothetical protein